MMTVPGLALVFVDRAAWPGMPTQNSAPHSNLLLAWRGQSGPLVFQLPKRIEPAELAAHLPACRPLAAPYWTALPWHLPKQEGERGCRVSCFQAREGRWCTLVTLALWHHMRFLQQTDSDAPHCLVHWSSPAWCKRTRVKRACHLTRLPDLEACWRGRRTVLQPASGQASLCHHPPGFAALGKRTTRSAQKPGVDSPKVTYKALEGGC